MMPHGFDNRSLWATYPEILKNLKFRDESHYAMMRLYVTPLGWSDVTGVIVEPLGLWGGKDCSKNFPLLYRGLQRTFLWFVFPLYYSYFFGRFTFNKEDVCGEDGNTWFLWIYYSSKLFTEFCNTYLR